MKSIALVILVAMLGFTGPAVAGGERSKDHHYLDASDDRFFKQYGGRVFNVWCGNRQVFIWKKADGVTGWFNCLDRRHSSNTKVVVREDRRWKPIY